MQSKNIIETKYTEFDENYLTSASPYGSIVLPTTINVLDFFTIAPKKKKIGISEKNIEIVYIDEEDLIVDDQSWYWTKEWQEGEKEADEDFKNGNFETFSNIDELTDYLS